MSEAPYTDIRTVWQARKVLPAITIGNTVLPAVEGEWEDVPFEFEEERNYTLFSMLAGVHSTHAVTLAISPPRGIPDDFEIDEDFNHRTTVGCLRLDYRNGYFKAQWDDPYEVWLGNYAHSWLLGRELLEYEKTVEAKDLNEQVVAFFNEVRRQCKLYGEVRIVFGFDD